jgi:hypothetical protein
MVYHVPTGFVLLTQAKTLFAFPSLKQVTYFVDKYASLIRQKRHGRRRFVSIEDLSAIVLKHTPRCRLSESLSVEETTPTNEDAFQKMTPRRATEYLRNEALAAYQSGLHWGEFWATNAALVLETKPSDTRAYHQFVFDLLNLVANGDGNTCMGSRLKNVSVIVDLKRKIAAAQQKIDQLESENTAIHGQLKWAMNQLNQVGKQLDAVRTENSCLRDYLKDIGRWEYWLAIWDRRKRRYGVNL